MFVFVWQQSGFAFFGAVTSVAALFDFKGFYFQKEEHIERNKEKTKKKKQKEKNNEKSFVCIWMVTIRLSYVCI